MSEENKTIYFKFVDDGKGNGTAIPTADFSGTANHMEVPPKNIDAGKKIEPETIVSPDELESKLHEIIQKTFEFADDYGPRMDEIIKKEGFNDNQVLVVEEKSKIISDKIDELVLRYEEGEQTVEIIDGLQKVMQEAENFLSSIPQIKIDLEKQAKIKIERDEFLGRDENKNWEKIFDEASKSIVRSKKTLTDFEKENPGEKADDSSDYDLKEKLKEYLSGEHVDLASEDERDLWRKVFGAAKMVCDKNMPKTCVVFDGKTYGIKRELAAKYQVEEKEELEREKEKRESETKFSRAGAEITLARVEKLDDLNAPSLKEGDEKFLEKTRELWKEFAVHGLIDKEGNFKTETDLDGKCCIALLKEAGLDVSMLKYVPQGATEDGYINIDTGGKDGVVVERNIDDTGVIEWSKTAHVDHHAKESKSRSSSAAYLHRMLIDMGLLKKTPEIERRIARMVHFVTREDSGENPIIKNYFDISGKTVAGLQRFMSEENFTKFFLDDSDPNPMRILSEEDLKKYEFLGIKDEDGKDIDRSKEQEGVAKLAKIRLEQMQKWGFIIPSERYGKIAVSVENVIKTRIGKKNLPGGFIAARAFGCDTLIIWNPKDNRFSISSDRIISDDFDKGFRVREKMWIMGADDNSELTFTLEEILKKMTDGKFVPEGKLQEYIEKGTVTLAEGKEKNASGGVIITVPEKPKEKTPKDLFLELQAELSVFSVETYQMLYNEMMDVAEKEGASGDEKKKLVLSVLPDFIERDIARHTRKKGEELKNISEYILSQIK